MQNLDPPGKHRSQKNRGGHSFPPRKRRNSPKGTRKTLLPDQIPGKNPGNSAKNPAHNPDGPDRGGRGGLHRQHMKTRPRARTDWRRRSQEPRRHIEISDQLLKDQTTNSEVQHYLEDIRSQQIVGGPESEDRTVFLIKWLIRIIIAPFALLSYEAYRTFNIVWSGGSPFVPHALAITVLSLSIVVVSIYYGFSVKYE